MKKIFFGLLFISTLMVFSQDKSIWLTSFDEAAKIAKKTKKPMLLNFTGSDWCGYCKVLDKKVFNTPEFKKWAKKNVVLLKLDFPRKFKLAPELAKQNNALKRAFGVRGFPTIHLIRPGKGKNPKQNLEAIGKTGYVKGGFSEWVKTIEQFL